MIDLLIWALLITCVAGAIVAVYDIVKYERRIKRLNDRLNGLERGRGRRSE